MSTSSSGATFVAASGPRHRVAFWLGVCLWMAAALITWPLSLSFGDEVGYTGQTRLLLEGRVHPTPLDPGVWHDGHQGPGLMPKYPLFFSIVLAPFLAISPTLLFLPGFLAAVALAWLAGRVLQSWGHSQLWGLIILVDPGVALLSRTVMADVALSFLAVGTWYFVRQQRAWPTLVFAALTMAIKAYGVVTVVAVLAGQSLMLWRDGRRFGGVLRTVAPLIAGMALGAAIVVVLNLISNGTIHSSYNVSTAQAFGLRFVPMSGVTYWKTLLVCPPLLFAGVLPYWRRRDWAALLALASYLGMFTIYFFVDRGVGFFDSLVLSRRLILPVIAFLLIGYAELLAQILGRVSDFRLARIGVLALPALVALGIGIKHRQWQLPSHQALTRAEAWAQQMRSRELGLTPSAFKVGLLYPGRTLFVTSEPNRARPLLVLCHSDAGSYRMSGLSYPCELPGYETVEALPEAGYVILRRASVN